MEPWQERVIQEKSEIDSKIESLDIFITGNSPFRTLPADERSRLRSQLGVMQEYSRILGERIKNFNG